METLDSLKSYSDLRQLVPPGVFTQTMNYLAWHNRQKMTPMMQIWQALLVAFALERQSIDTWQYQSINSYLRDFTGKPPQTVDECRTMAEDLVKHLSGTG